MEDRYGAREAAVLLEELRSEFKTVSETALPFREDMAEVKERLTRVEADLVEIKDAVRAGFPDIFKRLSRLETKVGN